MSGDGGNDLDAGHGVFEVLRRVPLAEREAMLKNPKLRLPQRMLQGLEDEDLRRLLVYQTGLLMHEKLNVDREGDAAKAAARWRAWME